MMSAFLLAMLTSLNLLSRLDFVQTEMIFLSCLLHQPYCFKFYDNWSTNLL